MSIYKVRLDDGSTMQAASRQRDAPAERPIAAGDRVWL